MVEETIESVHGATASCIPPTLSKIHEEMRKRAGDAVKLTIEEVEILQEAIRTDERNSTLTKKRKPGRPAKSKECNGGLTSEAEYA